MKLLDPVVHPGEVVCNSTDLIDQGPGVRFAIGGLHGPEAAFVVRHRGTVHAFLNRCAHKLVELDWEPGQFFDADRQHLICATHGARYEPASGLCVDGPCRGAQLVPVAVRETNGCIWLAGAADDVLK